MDLNPYVEALRHELALAAEAAGEESCAVAERLTAALGSAVHMTLLDALAEAAGEITQELAPGSVDLRLRGREPTFVVTLAPAEREDEAPAAPAHSLSLLPPTADADDSAMVRINLRLPEELKSRVEDAARQLGLSVNAWLVRSAAAALEADSRGRAAAKHPTGRGERFAGWVR